MLDQQYFTFIGAVLVIAEILGIIFAVHAVTQPRSSQGAIAWFIALIVIPLVTVPLYAVFGRTRFLGYAEALREAQTSVGSRLQDWFQRMNTMTAAPSPGLGVIETLTSKITKIPFLRANRVILLVDGKATYESMINAIESANSYILIELSKMIETLHPR